MASASVLLSGAGRAESPPLARDARALKAVAELERWAQEKRAAISVLVVHAHSGREVAAAFPDRALNPASNQKILTAAAALDVLGPEYRFTSLLAGRGATPTLSQLVLRSDGDPELGYEEVRSLVAELPRRGYRHVQELLVDQSSFDARWDPPGYAQRPKDWAAYRAPVSAVAVDRNAVTLYVAPGSVGNPAHVWFEPPGLVNVQGSIGTSASGTAQNVRMTVRRFGDRMEALLGGSVPQNAGVLSFSRRLAMPELAPGYVALDALAAHGVRVDAGPRAGGVEVREVLASRRSRPLSQILHALGKNSDNFSAEMLLKAIGRKATNGPGTTAGGAASVENYLTRIGALGAGTRVGNGSGLFDANRVSARTLVKVLATTLADARIGPELVASLAIAGVDGTLSQRLRAHRDGRRVRAKTGTLNDVVALAGYVLGASPLDTLAFAALTNDVAGKQAEARQRIDVLVDALASS